MANSNTEHSKRLRQNTTRERERAIVAAGGWQLKLLLQPEIAAILRDSIKRTGGTAVGIVSELIKTLEKK